MSDLKITSRYFVSGEGVRDKQWYRLTNDSPGTTYSIPTYDQLPVRRTFFSNIRPQVKIYSVSTEVHFVPPSDSISEHNAPESLKPATSLQNANGHSVPLRPVDDSAPTSNPENVPPSSSIVDSQSDSRAPTLASLRVNPATVPSVPQFSQPGLGLQSQQSLQPTAQSKEEPVPTTQQHQSPPFLIGTRPRNRKLSGVARLIAPPVSTSAAQNPIAIPLGPPQVSATSPDGGSSTASVPPIHVPEGEGTTENPTLEIISTAQNVEPRDLSPTTSGEVSRKHSHGPPSENQSEVQKDQAGKSKAQSAPSAHEKKALSIPFAEENLAPRAEASTLELRAASSSLQRRPLDKKHSLSDKISAESQREALENIVARHKVDKRRIKTLPPLPDPKQSIRLAPKPTENQNQDNVLKTTDAGERVEPHSAPQEPNEGPGLSVSAKEIESSSAIGKVQPTSNIVPKSLGTIESKTDMMSTPLPKYGSSEESVPPVAQLANDTDVSATKKGCDQKLPETAEAEISTKPIAATKVNVSTLNDLSSENLPSEQSPAVQVAAPPMDSSKLNFPTADDDSLERANVPSSVTKSVAPSDETKALALSPDTPGAHSSPNDNNVPSSPKATSELEAAEISSPCDQPLQQNAELNKTKAVPKADLISDKTSKIFAERSQENGNNRNGTDGRKVLTSPESHQADAIKSVVSPKKSGNSNNFSQKDSERTSFGSPESEYLIAVFKRLVKTIVRYNQKRALYRDGRFEENRRNFLHQLLSKLAVGERSFQMSPAVERQSKQSSAHSGPSLSGSEKYVARKRRTDSPSPENRRSIDTHQIQSPEQKPHKKTTSITKSAANDVKQDDNARSETDKQLPSDQEAGPFKMMKNMRFKMEEWKRKIVMGQAPHEDICSTMDRISSALLSSGQSSLLKHGVSNRELQTWLTDLESGHAALSFLWSSVSDGVLSLKGISADKEAVSERTVEHMRAMVNIVKWCQAVLKAIISRCELSTEQGSKAMDLLSFQKPITNFLDAGGKQGDRPDMFLLGKLRLISRRLSQTRTGNVRSSVNSAVDQLISEIDELLNLVSSLSDTALKLDDLRTNFASGRGAKHDRIRDRSVSASQSTKNNSRKNQGLESLNARLEGKTLVEKPGSPVQSVGTSRRPRNADTLDGRSSRGFSKVAGQKRKSDGLSNGGSTREENDPKRRMKDFATNESANDIRKRSQTNLNRRGKDGIELKSGTTTKGKGTPINKPLERREKGSPPTSKPEIASGSESRKFDKKRVIPATESGSVKSKDNLPPVPRHEVLKSSVAPLKLDKLNTQVNRAAVDLKDISPRIGRSYGPDSPRASGNDGRAIRNDRGSNAEILRRLMSTQSSLAREKGEDNERHRPNSNRNATAAQQAPPGILKKRIDERDGRNRISTSNLPRGSNDGQSNPFVKNSASGLRNADIGLDATRPKKRVSFSENLIQSEDISKCSREEIEVLFNDGFDILGDKNELQRQLVNERVACLSRGAIITCHGYLARYIEAIKREAEGVSPIGSDRMRLPYANSSARHWSRTFNMSLPAGRNVLDLGQTRPLLGGLGLRSARPPAIQRMPTPSAANDSAHTKTAEF